MVRKWQNEGLAGTDYESLFFVVPWRGWTSRLRHVRIFFQVAFRRASAYVPFLSCPCFRLGSGMRLSSNSDINAASFCSFRKSDFLRISSNRAFWSSVSHGAKSVVLDDLFLFACLYFRTVVTDGG